MGRRLIGLRTVIGGAIVSAVAVNAVFLQDGDHPAPLFAPSGAGQAAVPLPPRPGPRPDALLAQLQGELKAMGLYDGPVDGLDGPRSQAAISAYQKAQALPASGHGDEKLLQHMRLANKAGRSADDQTAAIAPGGDMHILQVQRVLAALGYAPGPLDGVAGASTREAIMRFEADRGMVQSGEMTQKLITELEHVSGMTIAADREG